MIKVIGGVGNCLLPERRRFAISARTPYGFGCWRYTLRQWVEQK